MQVTELPAVELAKLREKMKPVIAKHSEIVVRKPVFPLCRASCPKMRK